MSNYDCPGPVPQSNPPDTVEKAAMLMLDNKFGGLPVVEESGRLVGIISDQDVFKALVSITGVREGGIQLGIEIANQPGAMKPVFDLLRAHGARILSVLSANNQEGNRKVFLRLREMGKPRSRGSGHRRRQGTCPSVVLGAQRSASGLGG